MAINRLLSIAILLMALPSAGEIIPLEGQPFRPSQLRIEWQAPTNNLRQRMWVYKVIPQTLSSGVVSNAMSIGGFQSKDIVNAHDKNQICFQSSRQRPSRSLTIIPASGYMKYRDSEAIAPMGEQVEGVPEEKDLDRLARECLLQLGIDQALIAPTVRYSHGERGKYDASGKEIDVKVNERAASLLRQVDGVASYNRLQLGGFWIEFGNNAKISGFELTWPNIAPDVLRRTASPDEIVASIQKGLAIMPPFQRKDVSSAKKLTITEVTALYARGGNSEVRYYPIVLLNTIVASEDKEDTVALICPLLIGTTIGTPPNE